MAALSVQSCKGGMKKLGFFLANHRLQGGAKSLIGGHATADRQATKARLP